MHARTQHACGHTLSGEMFANKQAHVTHMRIHPSITYLHICKSTFIDSADAEQPILRFPQLLTLALL